MNLADVVSFISSLGNIQHEEAYGYQMYYVGKDHRMGFVTIADSDSDYDNVSNLDRDGVFRVNIGISRQTFDDLLGDLPSSQIDYTALNVFLPHPDYAKQNYICILNPSGDNEALTKDLITEAHAIATKRSQNYKG